MQLKALVLLGCALPIFGQKQPTTTEGATVPFPIIPALPASQVVDPNKVVLEIGDVKITAKQLDALVDVYPENTQIFARGPGKEQFADTIVRMIVLAQEARKRKIDETEKFKQQLHFSELNLLAGALTNLLPTEITVNDEVLRKYYEEHRCEYQNWKAHHIMVRFAGSPLPLKSGQADLTEEEAQAHALEIRKKLAGGADFAELARIESDDPSTAPTGGDMGELRHGKIFPTIEETVCSMKAGALSQPVKTSFGYHIIRLDTKEEKTFEEIKPTLEPKYRAEMAKKATEDLMAKTKVVKDPEYYKPVETTPAGPPKP